MCNSTENAILNFESLVVTKVLLGDNPFLGKQEKFAQGRNPKNPLIHSV